jgi:hypothetical protein
MGFRKDIERTPSEEMILLVDLSIQQSDFRFG